MEFLQIQMNTKLESFIFVALRFICAIFLANFLFKYTIYYDPF